MHEVGAEIAPSSGAVACYSGDERAYRQANLTIEFLKYRFRGIFHVNDSSYGIVGRNIFNLIVITLDEPQLMWAT